MSVAADVAGVAADVADVAADVADVAADVAGVATDVAGVAADAVVVTADVLAVVERGTLGAVAGANCPSCLAARCLYSIQRCFSFTSVAIRSAS